MEGRTNQGGQKARPDHVMRTTASPRCAQNAPCAGIKENNSTGRRQYRMKSSQQHTPQLDSPQAAVSAFAGTVVWRALCRWAQAQHGSCRIPTGFFRPNFANVDTTRLTLPCTAAYGKERVASPFLLMIPPDHVGAL